MIPLAVLITMLAAEGQGARLSLEADERVHTAIFSHDEQAVALLGWSVVLHALPGGERLVALEMSATEQGDAAGWSADGKRFATACRTFRTIHFDQVCVWDVSTGGPLASRNQGLPWTLVARELAFTADGRRMLTLDGDTVSVSSTAIATVSLRLPGEAFAAPTNAGWVALASARKPITIVDPATGLNLRTLAGAKLARQPHLSVDARGTRLALWNYISRSITVLDASSGSRVAEIDVGAESATDVVVTGQRLIVASETSVRTWSLRDGALLNTRRLDGALLGLSPSGRWFATRRDAETILLRRID